MSYLISVLDKSLVVEGVLLEQVLCNSLQLVQCVEQLGYYWYWFVEYYVVLVFVSLVLEVLVVWVLVQIWCICIGSGGVMLCYYVLYKVVENFNLLVVLVLGCVDLGVGKVFGGLLVLIVVLVVGCLVFVDFDQQLCDLEGYLFDVVFDVLVCLILQQVLECFLFGVSLQSVK